MSKVLNNKFEIFNKLKATALVLYAIFFAFMVYLDFDYYQENVNPNSLTDKQLEYALIYQQFGVTDEVDSKYLHTDRYKAINFVHKQSAINSPKFKTKINAYIDLAGRSLGAALFFFSVAILWKWAKWVFFRKEEVAEAPENENKTSDLQA